MAGCGEDTTGSLIILPLAILFVSHHFELFWKETHRKMLTKTTSFIYK